MDNMISVQEAKKIVSNSIPLWDSEIVFLSQGVGRVLSADILSSMNSPSFSSSAMDGYAIYHGDVPGKIPVVKTLSAGDLSHPTLKRGEAIRIMTGGRIPKGGTAVVPQEEVVIAGENKIFIPHSVVEGRHIRLEGEELKKGDVVLPQGTLLTPGGIGFLASLGIQKVSIFVPPEIAILPTGNELVTDPKEMKKGKVFESSSFAIQAALQKWNIAPTLFSPVADMRKNLYEAFQKALKEHDFVVVTGGVSVGGFDFVKEVLADLKVETLFWKVAQKPGKPLFFGKRGRQFFFGLPGNPASSLVCYYEYVEPALLQGMGYPDANLPVETGKIQKEFIKNETRSEFVRARAKRDENGLFIFPIEGQESHKMKSFALANCLMFVPAEKNKLEIGEEVMIQWL